MKLDFPKGFLWGGATWATGSESSRFADGKSADVWDTWYASDPGRFYNQISPENTIGMYSRYKEYISLLKNINANSYRFSISWARFIPDGYGKVNPKAVEFYSNLIDECKNNGIEPVICLWHFDLPQCMQDIGGWVNRDVVDYFVKYAIEVFKHFGNRVKYFMVHNEVGVHPMGGYLYDFHPPSIVDFKKSIQCGYNLLAAQAAVINVYHQKGYDGEIGTVLNPNPVYPRSDDEEDVKAANFVDMIRERIYLDISVHGEFPEDYWKFCQDYSLTPEGRKNDATIFKENTVQILGVNYYQPCRVKAPEPGFKLSFYPENDKQDTKSKMASDEQIMPEKFYSIYDMPGKVINPSRGWEIYPKGIYDTLMRVKNDYKNIKCFIGENGIGIENEEKYMDTSGIIQDDYRIDFYKQHLEWIHKAIDDGSNCMGFHVWAPFDVWSPLTTFKNRYGLYRYERETQSMTIKKSGQWASEVFKTNSLTLE